MSKQETKLLTPEFRVSFPSVFEPSGMDGAKKKYSVTMLIPKTVDISALKALRDAVIAEKFPDPSKRPKGLKNPIRDGDEKSELDGYAGHYFIAARSMTKPGLVNASVKPIISQDEFYAGCYARATITAYYYDQSGNKGVAFSLQNIQKLRDGEPFSGRSKAEDDFGPADGVQPVGVTAGSDDDMFA